MPPESVPRGAVGLALRTIESFRKAVDENVDVKNRPDLAAPSQNTAPRATGLLPPASARYRSLEDARAETSAKLAEALVGFAEITSQLDSVPNAIASYQEAIWILTPLSSELPDPEFRSRLAGSHYGLGALQLKSNSPREALTSFQRACEILEPLVEKHPEIVKYRTRLCALRQRPWRCSRQCRATGGGPG